MICGRFPLQMLSKLKDEDPLFLRLIFSQVFAANNVEVVTMTRTEHMSKEDKEHAKVRLLDNWPLKKL